MKKLIFKNGILVQGQIYEEETGTTIAVLNSDIQSKYGIMMAYAPDMFKVLKEIAELADDNRGATAEYIISEISNKVQNIIYNIQNAIGTECEKSGN